MNQQFYKNMALWVVLLLMILLLVTVLRQSKTAPQEITYTEFIAKLDAGEIERVTLEEGHVSGKVADGGDFATFVPPVYDTLVPKLQAKGVQITARPKRESCVWQQMLIWWVPFLVLIGLWVFFVRQMQAGGGKAMSFGKSRARLLTENQQRVTFDDVAGVEESKVELEEIIAFLRDPKKFTRLGGRIPKGVLLVGPPGTGKTLLARAVAGEAGVPFFSISGSDFVEMFVGVGASRVRDLFMQGKKHAPCIIFIDEIDAVGRHRGAGLGGGHDEREQTLNQLLVEMDGFESNEGVIMIAATNRPDVLDPALLRPGRFDRRVVVPRPDLRGRLAILKVHTRRVPLADDVELEVVARGTPGFVGADLQNLVNEAALLAARRDGQKVAMERLRARQGQGAARRRAAQHDHERRGQARHRLPRGRATRSSRCSTPTVRPGAQGHDHPARHGARRDADAPGRGPLQPDARADGGDDAPRDGRPRGRGARLRALLDGRLERPPAGDAARPRDGVQLRHERADRAGRLQRRLRRRVPRPRLRDARRTTASRRPRRSTTRCSRILRESYDEARARRCSSRRDVLDRIAEALLERETLEAPDLRLLLAGAAAAAAAAARGLARDAERARAAAPRRAGQGVPGRQAAGSRAGRGVDAWRRRSSRPTA